MSLKNSRAQYPDREACVGILKQNNTPEHIIEHCATVSYVAERIGEALLGKGLNLNLDLIISAAMLHDISRLEQDHAAVGGALLRELGLAEVAAAAEGHMYHVFPDSLTDFSELDVVCLGDRTVKEAIYVGFDKRMEDVIDRYADNPELMVKVRNNISRGRGAIDRLEQFIGRSIDELVESLKDTHEPFLHQEEKPDLYISCERNGVFEDESETESVLHQEEKPEQYTGCERNGIFEDESGIESYLLQVEKPGRYIGCEQNAVFKELSECELRICIAFPDMYEIGMSWSGLQILYHLLNGMDGVYCERVFAPALDLECLMLNDALPLMTLETKTPVSSMDILGFTLQYELSFTNVINMLHLARIPVRSSERAGRNYPLLIAGGPCSFNPEPLAEVFDLFLIGDGEEAAVELCDLFMAHKRLRFVQLNDNLLNECSDEAGQNGGEFIGFHSGLALDRQYFDNYDRKMQNSQLQSGAEYDRILDRDEIILSNISAMRTDRAVYLDEAARITGVYVPSFYESLYSDTAAFVGLRKLNGQAPDTVKKALVSDLDTSFVPEKPVIPLIEAVQSRASVELFRGCTRGCRFCQAGMIYRPVRERSQSLILEKAHQQLKNTGYDELSLMSLSTSDYSGIEKLASRLAADCKANNVALSIPSLRMNEFSLKMLEEIQGYKKTGLTFAPEAGSQRMRDVINKNITEDDILKSVSQAAAMGWHHIKFYFMIGLPGETHEDVLAIADIVRKSIYEAKRARQSGKAFSLTVSVSNFIPKPHTPFQWVRQEPQEALFEKICTLKDIFAKIRGVRFQYHDTKASHVEALIARGDRRLLGVMEKAWELGSRFDSWQEYFDYAKWQQAFSSVDMPMDTSGFDLGDVLPWDHIDSGVSREFLWTEWEKSLKGGKTQDCRGGCVSCGLQAR